MEKITKDTNLAEILELPGADHIRKKFSNRARKILAKYNLPCLGCPMAKFEIQNLKLGEVCKMYRIDIEKVLRELNEKIENE